MAAAAYLLVSRLAKSPAAAACDRRLAASLQKRPARPLTDVPLRAVSSLADGPRPYLLVAAASVRLLLLKRRREAALLAAAPAAGGALTACLQAFHRRPRPQSDGRPRRLGGFPSGHVVFATVFPGALCRLGAGGPSGGKRACLTAVAAATMAVSRVRLGAHWPSDALGGVAAGLFCLFALLEALDKP